MAIQLGKLGIWRNQRDKPTPDFAAGVEKLGFGALWIGGSPGGDLALIEELLDGTDHITVATGIVNMWATDAATAAADYHRIAAKHPNRFLLGVGIGHPEAVKEYRKPYDTIVEYLDQLDAAGVPVEDRALAALGPKVLKLAADRTLGAHPYLTTPDHTRQARAIVGPDKLLAPEQKVVLETDPAKARTIARAKVEHPYLHAVNYLNNLKRLGWSDEDLANGGSDSLIDALAPHGDAEAIAAAVTAHWDAGADHVCVQVLGDDPFPGYRALAEVLLQG
jgi:probable F420-dependent oxidoreductase